MSRIFLTSLFLSINWLPNGAHTNGPGGLAHVFMSEALRGGKQEHERNIWMHDDDGPLTNPTGVFAR